MAAWCFAPLRGLPGSRTPASNKGPGERPRFEVRRRVMPDQGRAVERAYIPEERTAMGNALPALGETTFDIYLDAHTFWCNVPAAVWRYELGGYQVLKKWLSYRERSILGRPLHPVEIQFFSYMARRIGMILLQVSSESAERCRVLLADRWSQATSHDAMDISSCTGKCRTD